MFLPLIALCTIQGGATVHTVELYRGADIPGVAPRYWEVEDTTLDATGADLNQGWQTELDGGDGKTILIQFQDLARALGQDKKIVNAKLVFTLLAGNASSYLGIGKVLLPWNQGPIKTLLGLNPSGDQIGAPGSATWRHRRLGMAGGAWQHVGAIGEEDSSPISEAAASGPGGDQLQIDHLEGVVQNEYDHPQSNHGFVLQFKGPVALGGSLAAGNRPRLIVQYQDLPPKSGADLTVAYIERKPEYERYENEIGFTVQDQDGAPVPVLDHPQNALTKKWPSQGEDLVYVAHVKNVGTAASTGFTAQWMIDEKAGPRLEINQPLAPGQEALIPLHFPFKSYEADHRLGSIALEILPKGDDVETSDKFLEIWQDALNIGVTVEKSFYDKAPAASGLRSFEGWIQAQIALLNQVYFPYSRFSFATDGVTERLRIQRITVVPDGSLEARTTPERGKWNLSYDAELYFPASDDQELASGNAADLPLLRRLGLQLGFVDLSLTSFPAGDPKLASVADQGTVPRGTEDLAPGLMGGGDTREEAKLLPTQVPDYQPYNDPLVEQANLQRTDLLSASSVSELTTDLGKRRGFQGDFLYDTPIAALCTVVDYNGNKLPHVALTFYQMVNGGFPSQTRSFKAVSNEDGVVPLFKRDVLAGEGDKLVIDHELKPNPFGRIDYRNLNGMFLVKAVYGGVTEWSALKLWQLADSFHRGQASVGFLKLAFNLPSDSLDETADLAKGKSISSSNGADLAALLDGTNAKEISLPTETGSWIEIDLGRDRTIGEIRVITRNGHFWKNFQISTYETGQKPTDARLWTQERNWPWSYRNRPDSVTAGVTSVAYRTTSRRFRYLRITNTGESAEAIPIGIEVIPVKQSS